MELIKSNKTHIKRQKGETSICGQVPWTKPVEKFTGDLSHVTCERCKEHIKNNSRA